MMFNPGADAFSEGVNVAYHELGHANPAALDDMHHAYTWFDDASASYMVFGDITRRGDKLAVGEDGFAATRTIRLYSVAARPPYKDDAPSYRCRLSNPPGAGFESVSWSPDGQNLAYQAGGSIYTIRIGRITSGCPELGRPRLLVRGGTSPSWGRGEPAVERQALAALAAGPALLSLTVGFGDADLADEGARGPRSGPTHACRFR